MLFLIFFKIAGSIADMSEIFVLFISFHSFNSSLFSANSELNTISKSSYIKDLGDLLDMKMRKDYRADVIINNYRTQVQIHGGKLV